MGEERRYSGLFTNLAHLAFEADCIEGICRQRSLPPLGQRATLYLWNLFAVCFRLPGHISEEVLGNISNIIHYYQGFGPNPATCVTRVQNVKSTPRMAGVDVLHLLSCSDTMFVDLLPIDFDPGVTTVVHHADDIVQFCVNFMSQWPLPESHRKMAPYPRNIIFTGMDTVRFPDGLIHCLSPSIKQSVLDTVEKSIRQRVRVGLQDRAPQNVGMEDMIQVRGYEECEFCPKASREVEQGEWLLPMQDAAEIAEDKQEKACPQKEYDDGETWQIAV
ncbi:hypothetical protein I350_03131 [Cryptococcus amylolentus CBS 6273]|uniref:Uncharacterized protein n=1 Tax=Cryptococcus amylolentus CBS 6273 TaxID=1296118 RepID=A0A1E3K8L6_9TREE|nr:hypothetical protein I350_03131 [Cryptococcus amylolentus CBS 6273]